MEQRKGQPEKGYVEPVEQRVRKVRDLFKGAEGLPEDWSPEMWVSGVMIKLGEAAHALHPQMAPGLRIVRAERELGCKLLIACAAICMDAVEALEREE